MDTFTRELPCQGCGNLETCIVIQSQLCSSEEDNCHLCINCLEEATSRLDNELYPYR